MESWTSGTTILGFACTVFDRAAQVLIVTTAPTAHRINTNCFDLKTLAHRLSFRSRRKLKTHLSGQRSAGDLVVAFEGLEVG